MEAPDGGSSMTAAFSILTQAIVIGWFGEHRVEAGDADTRYLLGVAIRQSGEDCKLSDWQVECGQHRQRMSSAEVATQTLVRLASDVDGA